MWRFESSSALQRGESSRSRQQTGKHNRSRRTNALLRHIELCHTVLAQQGERDAAEVRQRRVLKHHFGQPLRALTNDIVPADTTERTQTLMGADGVNCSQLWAKRANGELRGNWAAYLTLVSAVLTLSMSAK